MKKLIMFLCVVVAVLLTACGSRTYEVEVDVTVLSLEPLEPDPLVRVEMRIDTLTDSIIDNPEDGIVTYGILYTNFLADQVAEVEAGDELVLRCRTDDWLWYRIDGNTCFIK